MIREFPCNNSAPRCVFIITMNTKFLTLAAAALMIAGGFTPNLHAADDSSGAPRHGRFFQRIAERLNLTADQKTQIKTILAADKDTLQSLLGQLHDARINLRGAIQAADANEAGVRAASAKVAAVEADLAVERMKLYGKIAPVLTDEQRRKISAMEQRVDDFVDNVITQIGSGLDN